MKVILARLQLETLDRPPEDSIVFLDRPAIPQSIRPTDLAPQFCSESLRIDALWTGRRRPLVERFLEVRPCTA